jgi:cystine transport system substrate-binding protein
MTTRTTRTGTLALTAALALTLAACSSGGGSGASDQAGTAASTEASGGPLESGVLTVGTEGTYRPYSFHEEGSGDLTGYDVEVITAVADELGVDVKFEETQWDAIFAGLEAGRFDVIANQVSITPEREAKYTFSDPYTVSTGVIVVPKDETSITSMADLKGKTTAQSLTSNWYTLAQESGANVEAVEGWAQAVALVEQGRVDATVNDTLTFLDWQKSEGDTSLKIAAETDDESRSAVAFRKGSDSLVAVVDKALETLRKDGTLAKISEKYFGEDVSG